jgi:GTPase Era involved in 16S rRNA processing
LFFFPSLAQRSTHFFRKRFTKLDAHLVKRIDAPDEALRHDLVLINSKQLPYLVRVELAEKQAKRRSVAAERLVWCERVGTIAVLLLDLTL